MVAKQFQEVLEKIDYQEPFWSRFRTGFETEMSLVVLSDDLRVTEKVIRSHHSSWLSRDLSLAFDTISHNLRVWPCFWYFYQILGIPISELNENKEYQYAQKWPRVVISMNNRNKEMVNRWQVHRAAFLLECLLKPFCKSGRKFELNTIVSSVILLKLPMCQLLSRMGGGGGLKNKTEN